MNAYLTSTATAFTHAFFGGGTAAIVLDQVACDGTEDRLIDCPHVGIGNHNCFHNEDVGVRCDGTVTYIYLFPLP